MLARAAWIAATREYFTTQDLKVLRKIITSIKKHKHPLMSLSEGLRA